ncbi:MAG TPA: efflux RND transporter periplasmic adaptor subunit, partial [Acidobacteriota bacterium]|nr:efflux RND transporter periplasmic adaptor subunit [Acidobacteriota bacterium]
DAAAAKRAPATRAADATVPAAALVRRGSLAGVYVVREGRARLRWLRLGGTAGPDVVVLAGLDPGDSVALAPAELTDGRRVEAAR